MGGFTVFDDLPRFSMSAISFMYVPLACDCKCSTGRFQI